MDPLTTAATAFGIAASAVTSIHQLHEFIDRIVEAPKDLRQADEHLKDLQECIDSLRKLSLGDNATKSSIERSFKKAGVATSVNQCGETCKDFTEFLESKGWKTTGDDNARRLSLIEKWELGVWHREKVERYLTRIRSSQSLVQLAVNTAQLMQQAELEESKVIVQVDLKDQLDNLNQKFQEDCKQMIRQQAELEVRKAEYDNKKNDAENKCALEEANEQIDVLMEALVSCGVLSAGLQKGISQEIGNVVTRENSFATVGIVGMSDDIMARIKQRIGDVTTEDHSTSVVGIVSGDVAMRTE